MSYGTSNLKEADRPLDLVISNNTEMAAMRLPQATRFDLGHDNLVKLPWAEEFFTPRAGLSTPVIGHLTQSAIEQLRALVVIRGN